MTPFLVDLFGLMRLPSLFDLKHLLKIRQISIILDHGLTWTVGELGDWLTVTRHQF